MLDELKYFLCGEPEKNRTDILAEQNYWLHIIHELGMTEAAALEISLDEYMETKKCSFATLILGRMAAEYNLGSAPVWAMFTHGYRNEYKC